MRQDDGYLSVASGRMAVICKLHDAGWRSFVSCMSKNDGYLLAT